MTARNIKPIILSLSKEETAKLYNLLGVEPVDELRFVKLLNAFYSLKEYDKCISVNECAAWLGVHRNTVSRWITEGKIQTATENSIPKLQFVQKI